MIIGRIGEDIMLIKKSFYIGLLISITFVWLSVASCSLTPLEGIMMKISQTSSPDLNNANLVETAQAAVATEVSLQEEKERVAATETQTAHEASLSFDQKVQTAVALTQEAQETQIVFIQVVQTAVVQTQIAKTPTLSLEQQVQAAIAQTQTNLSQTQTAYGLTQVAILHTPQYVPSQTVVNDASFNGAYVYRYGFLQNNRYLVTMQLANNVVGAYYATIGGKTYKCSIIQDYPNRLYCTGPSVRGGSQPVLIYSDDANRLVYTGEVALPQWTPTWVRPSQRCCNINDSYSCDCYLYGNCNNNYSWNPCYDKNYNYNYNHNHIYNKYNTTTYGCPSCRSYDENGKCYYYDNGGSCRYCKTGNLCR